MRTIDSVVQAPTIANEMKATGIFLIPNFVVFLRQDLRTPQYGTECLCVVD
jgi:hypothetical protein